LLKTFSSTPEAQSSSGSLQSVYDSELTRIRFFALVDSLVVFYRRAADAGAAVLISVN
jgi:hypothetical protein